MVKKKIVKKVIAKTTKIEAISAKEYAQVLVVIKNKILTAQVEAITAVNRAHNELNWAIGRTIVEKQKEHKWGSFFVEMIAKDLQIIFPGQSGYSRTNVFRMKAFYLAYSNSSTAVELIDNLPIFNLPWGHNAVILVQVKDGNQRLWYAQKSIELGWSRTVLEEHIKKDSYCREGKAITNFNKTLPNPHSAMAQQSFKDPYVLNFLTLRDDYVEYDLEQGLIDNVEKLLLEMGKGFALIGRQYHLEVDEKDYYIDLLFYHVKLRCYIVVELKAREFDPRDAGQINFYLSAVDDLVRGPEDKPSIGLILCRTKRNFTAEYALRDLNKPIGVASYVTELMGKLSKELKSSLPTVEELETELEKKEMLVVQKEKKRKKKASS